MCGWEVHVGQGVCFRLVHEGGQPWQLEAQLVGDPAPLGTGCCCVFLGKCGGDEGGRHAAPLLAGVRRNSIQKIAASERPMSMPSTSRLPSVLTPTAMVMALEMMRPPSRP